MERLHQHFTVAYDYDVFFVDGIFEPATATLAEVLYRRVAQRRPRLLAVIDAGVAERHAGLCEQLAGYCRIWGVELAAPPLVAAGGEAAKSSFAFVDRVIGAIADAGICRHSAVLAVGGGALLDAVGFAAATTHRGVRLVRAPTTVLAQNEAGLGVKNAIDACGRKNFLGTFQPPAAVINDCRFLSTLEARDWRAGIAEAIKVALIGDAELFAFIERQAQALSARALAPMGALIRRTAELHLRHIAQGGDPFERGAARPLDFGHWAAHRLETICDHRLRHGEAVAIGIALDTLYSTLAGRLEQSAAMRVLDLLDALGFELYVPELADERLFEGIAQFREHPGGELSVTLLARIGQSVEVHALDENRYRTAISVLARRAERAPALAVGMA